ncbi:hypothetical protein O6H91_17G033600 [Diphasiastrum complanatum]|uniref:Uncharacterized protein n=1 Tax=Diphasiastrum complanatum TaxID=34168 RepID=A0ACC2B5K7_DIPCM|nr:hypothetical protein O6H91_17G033600 [Diphasiastrum complanatum]
MDKEDKGIRSLMKKLSSLTDAFQLAERSDCYLLYSTMYIITDCYLLSFLLLCREAEVRWPVIFYYSSDGTMMDGAITALSSPCFEAFLSLSLALSLSRARARDGRPLWRSFQKPVWVARLLGFGFFILVNFF